MPNTVEGGRSGKANPAEGKQGDSLVGGGKRSRRKLVKMAGLPEPDSSSIEGALQAIALADTLNSQGKLYRRGRQRGGTAEESASRKGKGRRVGSWS